MLTHFATILVASAALVRAQTPEVDAANIAQVKLVGAGGEVVDDAAYKPTVGVQIAFVDAGFEIDVVPGVLLTRNQTAAEPTIKLYSTTDISTKGFLVAMVDPDAPTPQDKHEAQVRHWVSENMVAGTGANNIYTLAKNANAVAKYAGPGPGDGSAPHRYTVVVYEQPTPAITAPGGDANVPFRQFDVAAYAAKIQGLKLVGATYFQVGPYGTNPNNGSYTAPVGGGSAPSGSNSGSAGPSNTRSNASPSASSAGATNPGGAAGALRIGAGSLLVGVIGLAAFFASA